MSDQIILKQILSNTEEVKEVVVTRENAEREEIDKRRKKRKEKQKESIWYDKNGEPERRTLKRPQ